MPELPGDLENVFAADPAAVAELAGLFAAAIRQIINERGANTRLIDLFMASHNLHKAIVKNVADSAGYDPGARVFFYRAAALTFDESMKREIANIVAEGLRAGRNEQANGRDENILGG